MPTLLKDLITIPDFVAKGYFMRKLTEDTDPAKVKATLDCYVVKKQLTASFDESRKLVQSALQGSRNTADLHGSFGSGRSHLMAVPEAPESEGLFDDAENRLNGLFA